MTNFEQDNNYEECVVTYLDVLGFKSHIYEKSGEEVSRILNRFRRAAEPYRFEDEAHDEAVARTEAGVEILSDAIVRARPVIENNRYGVLVHELMDLRYAQIGCIANGILVRGALTVDYLHLGGDLRGPYFGPGLIRAYEMERKEVVFPRIAIEERVIQRFTNRNDPSLRSDVNTYEYEVQFLNDILKEDESGLCFVDYLNAGPGEFDDAYAGLYEFFQRHHNLISSSLESLERPDILRKFNWLKKYHNSRICAEMESVELDKFEPELEDTPRNILEPLVID